MRSRDAAYERGRQGMFARLWCYRAQTYVEVEANFQAAVTRMKENIEKYLAAGLTSIINSKHFPQPIPQIWILWD